jgi:hypothetical protein
MADKNLFPVFDVPEIKTPAPAEEQKYKPSVYFDYALGDFRRDGANKLVMADGKEAWKQWCIKTVLTERLDRMSYSSDIGTELEDALKQADRQAVESALERTITEALMVNPKTEYVRGFNFIWDSDGLHCEFTVKGKEWEEQHIGVILET